MDTRTPSSTSASFYVSLPTSFPPPTRWEAGSTQTVAYQRKTGESPNLKEEQILDATKKFPSIYIAEQDMADCVARADQNQSVTWTKMATQWLEWEGIDTRNEAHVIAYLCSLILVAPVTIAAPVREYLRQGTIKAAPHISIFKNSNPIQLFHATYTKDRGHISLQWLTMRKSGELQYRVKRDL